MFLPVEEEGGGRVVVRGSISGEYSQQGRG